MLQGPTSLAVMGYLGETGSNKIWIFCHDVCRQVVEGMLRLAVQHEDIAEGLRGEGR